MPCSQAILLLEQSRNNGTADADHADASSVVELPTDCGEHLPARIYAGVAGNAFLRPEAVQAGMGKANAIGRSCWEPSVLCGEDMNKTQWKNLWHSFRWMQRFAEPYEAFAWAGRDDVSRKALRIAMKGI